MRVCVLSSDAAGQHAQALITSCLWADGRIECCETWGDRYNTGSTAADYDCLVLAGIPSPESHQWCLEQMEYYCRHGGGIVALGATLPALPEWFTGSVPVFRAAEDDGLLWRLEPAERCLRHPILRGVEPFCWRGDCCPLALPDDATILAWGLSGDTLKRPLAWVRRHIRARLFCTPLGHGDDFAQAGFLQLLANAVCWTGQ